MARYTKEIMYPLVDDYLKSSQSQREFCELHGIKVATFNYWLHKYRSKDIHSESSFIEVDLDRVTDHGGGYIMELESSTGTIFRFKELVSSDYVSELLRL